MINNIRLARQLCAQAPNITAAVSLPPQLIRYSNFIPLHSSAFKHLSEDKFKRFVSETSGKDIKLIMDMGNWEKNLPQFSAAGLEAREVIVLDAGGRHHRVRVIMDKTAEILGTTLRVVFEGKEYELRLAGNAPNVGGVPIIAPPHRPAIKEETVLQGRGASPFIGMGRGFVPSRPDISKFKAESITEEQVAAEIKEAREAFLAVAKIKRESLSLIKDPEITLRVDAVLKEINSLCEETLEKIEKDRINLKAALDASELLNGVFKLAASGQENFRMIASDFRRLYEDIILQRHNQLPDLLADVESEVRLHKGEKVGLACQGIDYIEAATLDPSKTGGIAEVKGGIMSHTALACKSLEIPLVIGATGATEKIKPGDLVIIDGVRGIVIVNPTPATVKKYERMISEAALVRKHLHAKYKDRMGVTKDNVRIGLYLNSKSMLDMERIEHAGTNDGIGLFRTEESMDVTMVDGRIVKREKEPSLEELIEFYEAMYKSYGNPDSITFRTIDINGDKYIPYLGKPAGDLLGLTDEGIGLCLNGDDHKPYYELFRNQVKAILIAAAKMKIKNPIIEFPMVISANQFMKAKRVVRQFMKEMQKDGIAYAIDPRFYSMIEHPSAVEDVEKLKRMAKGFAIGSNDLTMKTLFESRYSAKGEFNELHPDILELIRKTVDAAGTKIHCLVCGDMASDPIAIPVLLGLGVRNFSVDTSSLDIVKSMICNIDVASCEKLVAELKDIKTADEVRQHVIRFIERMMNHGSWGGLKELESILKTYTAGSDGVAGLTGQPT